MRIYSLPISLLYFTRFVIALAVIEFQRIENYDYWLTMVCCLVFDIKEF